MDNATLIQLLRSRGPVEASVPDVPMPPGPPVGQSPTMTDAFSRLQALSGKAVDYAPIGRIAAGNIENADRDRQYGMILQGLGGKHLAPVGKELLTHALEQGKPFRPNAADTAYMDPETGQMIENPAAPLAREIKVTENEVAQRRQEEAARLKREEDKASKAEAQRISEEQNLRHDATLRAIAQLAATSRVEAAGKKGGLKQLPAAQSKAWIGNNTSLAKIGEAVSALTANPDAFGLQNFLPETLTQRLPGQKFEGGVNARSRVADIGSLKIHDRSGAAVTVAETPRLLPFIPNVRDAPDVAKTKLDNLKREYELMNQEIKDYAADQGYHTPGVTAAAWGAATADADAALIAKYSKKGK